MINYADIFPYTSGQSFADELNSRFVAIKTAFNTSVVTPPNVIKYRGAYDAATDYVANDIVSSGGGKWLALAGSTNSAPVEGVDWTAFGGGGAAPTGAANLFYATPHDSTGAAILRAIVAADLPTGTTTTKGAVLIASAGSATAGRVMAADDPRGSDARAPTVHTHLASAISDFSQAVRESMEYAIGAPVQTIAELRAVAVANRQDKQQRLVEDSGVNYRFDLQGVGAEDGAGTIAPTSGVGRWFRSSVAGLAAVATSGAYADLQGKPGEAGLGAIHSVIGTALNAGDSGTIYGDIVINTNSTQAALQTQIQAKGGDFSNRTVELTVVTPSTPVNRLTGVVGVANNTTSENSGSLTASKTTDGNLTTYYKSASLPAILTFDLGQSRDIGSYKIVYSYPDAPSRPSAWTLEASATGLFTGEQTTVDTQNVTGALAASYPLSQVRNFRYWRVTVTAANGSSATVISEIELTSPPVSGSLNLTVNVPASAGKVPPILASPGAKYVGKTTPYGFDASIIRGLGNAAALNVGTSAGDVAAGDDGRFGNVQNVAFIANAAALTANQVKPTLVLTGALTATGTLTIADDARALVNVINATTGGFAVDVKTTTGATYNVPALSEGIIKITSIGVINAINRLTLENTSTLQTQKFYLDVIVDEGNAGRNALYIYPDLSSNNIYFGRVGNTTFLNFKYVTALLNMPAFTMTAQSRINFQDSGAGIQRGAGSTGLLLNYNTSTLAVATTLAWNSGLELGASTAFTAATTLTNVHYALYFDTTSANINQSLPSSAGLDGREYVFFKTVAGNSLTITPPTGQGVATTLSTLDSCVVYRAYASKWRRVSLVN